MKTKTIPFDLETAKKIQAGEIEGRIVNEIGANVQIISLNVENTLGPIAVLAHCGDGKDYIYTFYESGVPSRKGVYKLLLELPEETPKQDSFNKKLHDTAEVLATPKHEFKEGDKVHIISDNVRGEIKSIGKYGVIVREYSNYTYIDHDCSFSNVELIKEESQHEFKPFDKVLVRNDEDADGELDIWVISFFMDESIAGYRVLNGAWFDQCIPYEGNEHLLGTDKDPKEE